MAEQSSHRSKSTGTRRRGLKLAKTADRNPDARPGCSSFVFVLHGGPVVFWRNGAVWELWELQSKRRTSALVEEKLLAHLILLGGYPPRRVPIEELRRAMGWAKWHDQDLTALRKWLQGWSGGNPVRRRRDHVQLDPNAVDVDLWRVEAAEAAAASLTAGHDPYERARLLYDAEAAWVESLRQTPEAILTDATKGCLASELQRFGERRWKVRTDYIHALIEAGHTSRVVTEYSLWREVASDGDHRERLFCASAPRSRARGVPPVLDAIGEMLVNAGARTTTVWEEADRRRARLPRPKALARPERARLDQLLGPPAPAAAVPAELQWGDVSILVRSLVHRLLEESFLPQVVIGIARGGVIPGSLLAHALGCRELGWVAASHRGSAGWPNARSVAHVRGAELPRLQASRVLLVDDVVITGRTCRLAIDHGTQGVRQHFPEARIAVAGLVMGKEHLDSQRDGELWFGGYETRFGDAGRQWVDFPWEPRLQIAAWEGDGSGTNPGVASGSLRQVLAGKLRGVVGDLEEVIEGLT
ncbi:MAG: hypothetical protein M3326_06440 [Actinomycetota bacterium]|nr:hypothetical protein [Actinomycetota bacterium]